MSSSVKQLTENITKINTKLSSLKLDGESKRTQVETISLAISDALVEGRDVEKETKARNALRDTVSDIASACISLTSRLQLEQKALEEAQIQETREALEKRHIELEKEGKRLAKSYEDTIVSTVETEQAVRRHNEGLKEVWRTLQLSEDIPVIPVYDIQYAVEKGKYSHLANQRQRQSLLEMENNRSVSQATQIASQQAEIDYKTAQSKKAADAEKQFISKEAMAARVKEQVDAIKSVR